MSDPHCHGVRGAAPVLRHSAEYTFDHVFWVPYDKWRREQGSGQGEGEERGALEEVREGEEETME